MSSYTLYSYFRSSSSTRVRIALHHKQIAFQYVPVHLLADGGEQYLEAYKTRNPMSEVPALSIADGAGDPFHLAQSVAILEYLEEAHPEPALLPVDLLERARVRQLVEIVNSSIQPIQNLKVFKELTARFGTDRPANLEWARFWITRGFEGFERILRSTAGRFAHGDSVTLADVVLVPQVYNADRFAVDMTQFPVIDRIATAARELPAFRAAMPDAQPDAQ